MPCFSITSGCKAAEKQAKHLQNIWKSSTFQKPIQATSIKMCITKRGIIVTDFVKLYLLTVLKFIRSNCFSNCLFHTITTAVSWFYIGIQLNPENWFNSLGDICHTVVPCLCQTTQVATKSVQADCCASAKLH